MFSHTDAPGTAPASSTGKDESGTPPSAVPKATLRSGLVIGVLLCVLLLAGGARAGLDGPPGGAAAVWLASRADSLLRAVMRARAAQDAGGLSAAESTYASVLDSAASLIGTGPDSLVCAPSGERLLWHLLLDRRSAAIERLFEPGFADLVRKSGRMAFWAALGAKSRKRWREAALYFHSAAEPMLVPLSQILEVRCLAHVDSALAEGRALALVRRYPQHPFRTELLLWAVGGLLRAHDLRMARMVLGREPARRSSPDLWMLQAELERRSGNVSRAGEALLEAVGRGRPRYGLGLRYGIGVGRYLAQRKRLSGPLGAAVVKVLAWGGLAESALRTWEHFACGFSPTDSVEAGLALLSLLYSKHLDARLEQVGSSLRRSSVRRARMEAASYLGRARWREGALEEADSLLKIACLWESPRKPRLTGEEAVVAEAALWRLGRLAEERGCFDEAARAFGRYSKWFPGSRKALDASLRRSLSMMEAGDSASARRALDSLCSSVGRWACGGPCFYASAGLPEDEARYYLEKAAGEVCPGYYARRAAAALRDSESVTQPDSVWGRLARQVHDFKRLPRGVRVEVPDAVVGLVAGNPVAEAAMALLAYGRRTWAWRLIRHLPGWRALSRTERAAVLRALGDFKRSIGISIKDSHCLTRYPVGYAWAVEQAARAAGLSPFFVLAVMRQESMLDPCAVSGAGAVGLMQLMPATARRTAAGMMSDYDLMRPEDNVRLGTVHLAELLKETEGDVAVALAAYNAGMEKASEWKTDSGGTDRYILGIGYLETRRFVHLVLAHYWNYLAYYGLQ